MPSPAKGLKDKTMSTVTKIRLGTRKSPLALAQAKEVAELLAQSWPALAAPGAVEIVPMMTSGDAFTGRPLSQEGGKGLFTKEIEEALLGQRIDIAVHSMKDMPTMLPDGLTIGCMLEREDPRDMLVGEGLRDLSGLPQGAVFGTSSLRRAAMLRLYRPDLKIVPFRGNVETRLKKLAEGQAQATMLAMAGLNRLHRHDVPGHPLPWEEFLPAVAQGAIGVECRADDEPVLEALAPLAHIETEIAVLCERAFLSALDGSCRTPIAGYATVEGDAISFRGLILKPDGSQHHSIEVSGPAHEAQQLGMHAGEALLAKAGKNFLS